MTKRPDLRVVPSSGAPKPTIVHHEDGSFEQWSRRPRPCEGCRFVSAPKDLMTWYSGSWWHIACARKDLANRPSSAAWFELAEQVVKRPSSFKASEVKVIMRKILDVAVGPLDGDAA